MGTMEVVMAWGNSQLLEGHASMEAEHDFVLYVQTWQISLLPTSMPHHGLLLLFHSYASLQPRVLRYLHAYFDGESSLGIVKPDDATWSCKICAFYMLAVAIFATL